MEKNRDRDLHRVAMEHERQLREIDRNSCQAKLDAASEAVDDARRWYESPLFVAAVTFAGTLGIVWVAGEAITK
jgi:hypothetical protein